ncbi:MAG: hypothetical protein UY79_C0003G0056 [Parcubacteria group bacterium GW2011_GWA2_53_21]|nr:MAG: hypothetical protein UY79_C0003G0056 [Parcubacteria group bacterium GW2011_GWA2_53_21]
MRTTTVFTASDDHVEVCSLDFPFTRPANGGMRVSAIKSLHLPCIEFDPPADRHGRGLVLFKAWLGITLVRSFPDFDRKSRGGFPLRCPLRNKHPSFPILNGSRLALPLVCLNKVNFTSV